MKKEALVKKEVKDVPEEMLAVEDDVRPWWVKELTLVDAVRHPDNRVDEPGLHVLPVEMLLSIRTLGEDYSDVNQNCGHAL
jgi:hypothetical protein